METHDSSSQKKKKRASIQLQNIRENMTHDKIVGKSFKMMELG